MKQAQVAAPHEPEAGYVHEASAFDDELSRLRLLEQRYDARTFARLSALGPLAGTRCLEVGAGAGSVARWLAAQVGPAGQVVATDADPRFLSVATDGFEVRRHDILTGPPERRRYDLVHCRALLCHLTDPSQALQDMAAAVRPGGWLLAEDADYVSLVAADPAHPRSASFDAVMRKLLTFFATSRSFDPFLGRRLPSLVAAAGLADAGCEAIARHRQGGSAAAELLRRSLERTRDRAVCHGTVDAGELEAVLAATQDLSFSFMDALSVAAWGRVAALPPRTAASPSGNPQWLPPRGAPPGTNADQIITSARPVSASGNHL
jgi:SAM-dependent methyltransferase